MALQYETDQYQRKSFSVGGGKGMAEWLVRKGWAKNAAGANLVLLIFAVVLIGVSFWLFSLTGPQRDGSESVTIDELREVFPNKSDKEIKEIIGN